MPDPKIHDRLVGGWRLAGYEVTAGDKTDHPLGDDPLGAILYTPDGYMSAQLAGPGPYYDDDQPDAYYIAYSGPYDVDETSQTVAHHVQVSVIPSWLGTTQIRQVRFQGPDKLALTASERRHDGVMSTTLISWTRQPPR
jgi:Lipocalin-like domain